MYIQPFHYFGTPYYIKKEDAHLIADWQQKTTAFTLLGMAISIGFIQLSVTPKLHEIYAQMRLSEPTSMLATNTLQWVFVAVCLLVGLQQLTSKPDYQRIDNLTKQYKKGEMILTSQLLDKKLSWLFLIILLPLLSLIYGTIMPIYNLTSSM